MPGNGGPCRKEIFVFFGFVYIVLPVLALVSFVLLFFFFEKMFCNLQVNGTVGKFFSLWPI